MQKHKVFATTEDMTSDMYIIYYYGATACVFLGIREIQGPGIPNR